MTAFSGWRLLLAYAGLASDPTRTDREDSEMHHYAMALQEDWVDTETPCLRWLPSDESRQQPA